MKNAKDLLSILTILKIDFSDDRTFIQLTEIYETYKDSDKDFSPSIIKQINQIIKQNPLISRELLLHNIIIQCDALKKEHEDKNNWSSSYSFSNEEDFDITIAKLAKIPETKSENVRIAMLVGESNFISLLPEIKLHADLILFNDINPFINEQTKSLLDSLAKTNSPTEFLAHLRKYSKSFISYDWELRTDLQKSSSTDFMSSSRRFSECKKAAEKLRFAWCSINLFEISQTKSLATLLKANNASIQVINISNVHQYDSGTMEPSLNLLLESSDNPIVLYSINEQNPKTGMLPLKSKIGIGKEVYRTIIGEFLDTHLFKDKDLLCMEEDVAEKSCLYFNESIRKSLQAESKLPMELIPMIKIQKKESTFLEDYVFILYLEDPKAEFSEAQWSKSKEVCYALLQHINPWRFGRYYDQDNFDFSLRTSNPAMTQYFVNFIEEYQQKESTSQISLIASGLSTFAKKNSDQKPIHQEPKKKPGCNIL